MPVRQPQSAQCRVDATPAIDATPEQLFAPVNDLPLSMVYTIGILDAEDGSSWFPVRGFFTDVTRSARPMVAPPGGDYTLAPEAADCYSGPVESGRRDASWGFRQPDGTSLLTLNGSDVELAEGGFLAIGGDAVGPACRLSVDHPDHPLVYTSRAFRVRGRIRDCAVDGVLFVDAIHTLPGRSLFPSPYVESLQVAWCSFANELVDGTWESGLLLAGREGYSAISVQHDGQPLAATGRLDSAAYDVEAAEPGFPRRITVNGAGQSFDWRAPDAGRWPVMSHYAPDHRMRRGTLQRMGAGPVLRSLALVEGYVDRMAEHP